MNAFEPEGAGYVILLELKEEIGGMRSDIKRLLPLEGRVASLELAQAGTTGEKRAGAESRDRLRMIAILAGPIIATGALVVSIFR